MLHRILLFIIISIVSTNSFAQTNIEVFGQNRVQYKTIQWKYIESPHFKIYHYERAGTDLARYVAEQAEHDVAAVETRLGSGFPDWINIMVYNCYDDYWQSNIGYKPGGQITNNPAGTVDLVGDKLCIYFTGNHADLKNQLRRGIAMVAMERMLFGDNLRQMIRNAVLLNIPDWAIKGYIGYVVDGWTVSSDNQWKNIITDTIHKLYFNDIAEQQPEVAGKAFWKYISERYGENFIKNILYTTQLKSSLNKALKLNIGLNVRQTYDSLMSYYKDIYELQAPLFQNPDTASALLTIPVPNDESIIRDIKVSPRGVDVAYVQWQHGEYKVIFHKADVTKKSAAYKNIPLLEGGVKDYNAIPDPNYPIIQWSNTGFKLGIIYNFKNRIRIKLYDAIKGKMERYTIPPNRFDRILSFTFTDDDNVLLVSAIRKGKTDIYEYRLKRKRINAITDDSWDDLEPIYLSGGSRKGIVFLSNRTEPYINIQPLPNELPGKHFNAYFYSTTTKRMELLPIASMPKGNITQVIPYGPDNFAFLSDINGVQNRYVVLFGRNAQNIDSAYSVPMTNYEYSILYQQYNPASAKIADVIQKNSKYYIYFQPITLPPPYGNTTPSQPIVLPQIDEAVGKKISPILFIDNNTKTNNDSNYSAQQNNGLNVVNGNEFQSEFANSKTVTNNTDTSTTNNEESQLFAQQLNINNPTDSVNTASNHISSSPPQQLGNINVKNKNERILYVDSTYIQMRAKKYRSTFHFDFFSVRLDNSIIFNKYQPYTGNGGQFTNPPMSGMLSASLYDKFEDYRLTGGIRVPLDFSSHSYLLQFQNFKRRFDWGLTFLRTDEKQDYSFYINSPQGPTIVGEPGKTITTLFQGDLTYPFDRVKSIRLQMAFRKDDMIIKAQDRIGLELPSIKQYFAMSHAEFVFDNTRNPAYNIYNGLGYKLYAEYMYKLYSNNKYYTTQGSIDSTKTGGFYNVGFDMRYYKKLYHNFIAAIRVAGAHSGGTEKVMYQLGGVDDPIGAKHDNTMPPSTKNNYAFQALATNMRGYLQNARNGNTFAVLNAELRLPVFTTFFHRPIQSNLLKNFQLVAFLDAGSAWEGILPNEDRSRDSYFYTPDPFNPSVIVTIHHSSPGIALGYGIGARTMLFGYFFRVDAAWNIEKNFMWHFSIGTDF